MSNQILGENENLYEVKFLVNEKAIKREVLCEDKGFSLISKMLNEASKMHASSLNVTKNGETILVLDIGYSNSFIY